MCRHCLVYIDCIIVPAEMSSFPKGLWTIYGKYTEEFRKDGRTCTHGARSGEVETRGAPRLLSVSHADVTSHPHARHLLSAPSNRVFFTKYNRESIRRMNKPSYYTAALSKSKRHSKRLARALASLRSPDRVLCDHTRSL